MFKNIEEVIEYLDELAERLNDADWDGEDMPTSTSNKMTRVLNELDELVTELEH